MQERADTDQQNDPDLYREHDRRAPDSDQDRRRIDRGSQEKEYQNNVEDAEEDDRAGSEPRPSPKILRHT
ncbi:MAG: hypothetical protein Q7V57_17260 [Actinomycetota bacterium]|nr:hypothetical protein [Actinomycetota bacterium]